MRIVGTHRTRAAAAPAANDARPFAVGEPGPRGRLRVDLDDTPRGRPPFSSPTRRVCAPDW